MLLCTSGGWNPHTTLKREVGSLWIISDIPALLQEFHLTSWVSSSMWCGRGRTTWGAGCPASTHVLTGHPAAVSDHPQWLNPFGSTKSVLFPLPKHKTCRNVLFLISPPTCQVWIKSLCCFKRKPKLEWISRILENKKNSLECYKGIYNIKGKICPRFIILIQSSRAMNLKLEYGIWFWCLEAKTWPSQTQFPSSCTAFWGRV